VEIGGPQGPIMSLAEGIRTSKGRRGGKVENYLKRRSEDLNLLNLGRIVDQGRRGWGIRGQALKEP